MARLKTTPAQRRALSYGHTDAWLKDRPQAWAAHVAELDQAAADRQRSADAVTQQRKASWDDWHAAERQRQHTRDAGYDARAQALATAAEAVKAELDGAVRYLAMRAEGAAAAGTGRDVPAQARHGVDQALLKMMALHTMITEEASGES